MLAFLFGFLAVVILAFLIILGIGYYLSVPGYKGPVTDHFDGKKFHNPSGKPAKGLREVFKFMREERGAWIPEPDAPVRNDPFGLTEGNKDTITFVNHSTFLIRSNGINILTDPVWSERCSPFAWVGPKRLRPPGVAFQCLPNIDLVLLSHNHYDHLDLPTVKRIKQAYDPTFIVPLGMRKFLNRKGITKVMELDWWGKTDFSGLEITATPANHFSSRGMFDRDTTLWCGFLIKSSARTIYFVGDTGYSDIFREIGTRAGTVDIACIPIGAYEPKWFMSPIHVSPEEAVRIHKEVGSLRSLAMHFGTFPLANEGSGTAQHALLREIESQGIDQDAFFIPKEGVTYEI